MYHVKRLISIPGYVGPSTGANREMFLIDYKCLAAFLGGS